MKIYLSMTHPYYLQNRIKQSKTLINTEKAPKLNKINISFKIHLNQFKEINQISYAQNTTKLKKY